VNLSLSQPQGEPSSSPVTIWVSNIGSNDTSSCGSDKATACTLLAAFGRATDVLHVPPSLEFLLCGGDYALSRINLQGFTDLTIKSAPDEETRARLLAESPATDSGAFGLSGRHVSIADVSFSNFQAGALRIKAEEASFRNVEFVGNIVQAAGGAAIDADISRTAKFQNCSFESNFVQYVQLKAIDSLSGGAVNIRALQNNSQVGVEFQECKFRGNGIGAYQSTKFPSGGALAIEVKPAFADSIATVTMQDCLFEDNAISVFRSEDFDSRSSARGGAVSVVGSVKVVAARSSFTVRPTTFSFLNSSHHLLIITMSSGKQDHLHGRSRRDRLRRSHLCPRSAGCRHRAFRL
jgi:hypothetical protein